MIGNCGKYRRRYDGLDWRNRSSLPIPPLRCPGEGEGRLGAPRRRIQNLIRLENAMRPNSINAVFPIWHRCVSLPIRAALELPRTPKLRPIPSLGRVGRLVGLAGISTVRSQDETTLFRDEIRLSKTPEIRSLDNYQ